MTGEVVNLIFLGTGEHRDKTHSALTQLYNNISDAQKPFTRLFDGPGSKPGKGSENPMPGQYSYNPETGKKEPYHQKDSRTEKFYELCQAVSGNLAGDGVEDNMMEAMLWLAKTIETYGHNPPETINLYGFSRGGDTAIRMSNLLAAVYPDVKLNIFAFDPVPGPARRGHYEAKTIPAAVEEICCVYAMDENRPGFEPEDPSMFLFESPETTRVRTQFYRGVHADPTKLRHADDTHNATGKLGWDDCFNFAERHGTTLQGETRPNYITVHKDKEGKKSYKTDMQSQVLDSANRLDLYDQMQSDHGFYQKQRFSKMGQRDFVTHRSRYVKDADIFINQEHRELFKDHYPNAFDWFFQNNAEKLRAEFVITDLQDMQSKHPSLFAALSKKFSIEPIGDSFKIRMPQGDAIIETFKTGKPLVHDQLSYLQFAIVNALNYIDHNPATALNYQFVAACAQNMRKEFDAINKSPENTAEEKKEKCKDLTMLVIRNSLLFKSARIDSKFLYMLDGIIDNPEAATLRVKAVFDWHQQQNSKVINDDPIKDLLKATQNVINGIAESTDLSKLEKQVMMQEVLNSCKTTLNKTIPPEDQSKEIKQLNQHLDILIKEIGGNLQYADRAIALLEKYFFKNEIRTLFQKILDTFGIANTLDLSLVKQGITAQALHQLKELKQDGKGNDKDAIEKIIKDALSTSTATTKIYEKDKGSLDATLQQCLNEIKSLQSTATAHDKPTQTSSPAFQG